MKAAIIVIMLLLALAEAVMYFEFRRFARRHANEPVEQNGKKLLRRSYTMLALPLLAVLATVIVLIVCR